MLLSRVFDVWAFALLIGGSCNDISIKGLDTTVLVEELKNLESTPTVDSSSEGTSDNLETDASDEDEPLFLSPLTAGDSRTASEAELSAGSARAPSASSVGKLSAHANTASRSTLPASPSDR